MTDIPQAWTSSEVDTCRCGWGCMSRLGIGMMASHCGWQPARPPVSGGRTFPCWHQNSLVSGMDTKGEQLSGEESPASPSWHEAQAREFWQCEGCIWAHCHGGNRSRHCNPWCSRDPPLMVVSRGTESVWVYDSPSKPHRWWHRGDTPVSTWSALRGLWRNLRSCSNLLWCALSSH
jgi:hypothetical protein